MVPVAVRYSDEEIAQLDEFISNGRFPSRTEALRAALRSFLKAERERDLVELYREAYRRVPETDEEHQWAEDALEVFFEDSPEEDEQLIP